MKMEEGSVEKENLVFGYIRFQSYTPTKIAMEHVRLARVKPGYEFHFIYLDWSDTEIFQNKPLGELSDNGFIVIFDKVRVEVKYLSYSMWVKIGIKRESVEMVSTRLYREACTRIFWSNRSGQLLSHEDLLTPLLDEWKKTSKQFAIDSSNASAGAPGLSPPSHVIKANLYKHQKQGLKWMIDREQGLDDELPPFWEYHKCVGLYQGTRTYAITSKRPQLLRGGILADESGMGKTLTLLSLIAYSAAAASHIGKKRKADDVDSDVWRPTLVVCPPSVLFTWKEQIEQFTHPGSLKVCIYHGRRSKFREPSLLRRNDLVLTTYGVLVNEHQSGSPLLSQIDWWRVILDDVHVLKGSTDRATGPFMNLKSDRRWAVTGKPVHKDTENYNMFPIFAFLQVQQFCHKRDWEMSVDCGKPRGFSLLSSNLELLMEIFSLRRTMPAKYVENHWVLLSKEERAMYKSIEAETKETIRWSDGQALQSALLQLRQICNGLTLFHLSWVEKMNFQDLSSVPELHDKWVTVLLQEQEDCVCPICLDQPDNSIITRCSHLFCASCIMRTFDKYEEEKARCPMCRRSLTKNDIFSPQSRPSDVEKMKVLVSKESSSANKSSKVAALLNLLIKSRTEFPNRKSVVISQFRRVLMLADGLLSEAGFDVRCTGVTDHAKTKAKTINEFNSAENPMVLLTTFKTLNSITGLDLSEGSNVYMMEPCWNFHTEASVLACFHRLGMKDDVNVIRIVCKGTIEEGLLKMRKLKPEYNFSSSLEEFGRNSKDEARKLLGL